MKKIVCVLAVFVVCFGACLGSAQTYQLIDLGTLGGTWSQAEGINDGGQVVGFAYLPDSNGHGFVYLNGLMQDLGTLGGSLSDAVDINASGQIAGYAQLEDPTISHAYLRSTNGILQDIHSLGDISIAQGINSSGHVVGYYYTSGQTDFRSFLYTNTAMVDLGTFGGVYSFVRDINDSGQIIGYYVTDDGIQHPFIRSSAGVKTDIGPSNVSGLPRAINNSGQVVGRTRSSAFLYTNGTLTILGAGTASAISQNGKIVGMDSSGHAAMFTNNTVIDLNTRIPSGSGWVLQEATGVNSAGQIVGYGIAPNGETHAFMLQPPLPLKIIGSTITMGVTVQGTYPISYQWYFKNAAIAGATTSSLTITNGSETGTYKIKVTDPSGLTDQQSFTANIKPN